MRWLIGSIPDWNYLFSEAYKVLKPGAWIESFEPSAWIKSDHTEIAPTSALGQWGRIFTEGAKKFGRSFSVIEDELQRKGMEAAGFVDIQTFSYKVRLFSNACQIIY